MPLLMLKDVPRYECLLDAALRYPDLDPPASAAFLHLLRTGDEVYEAESRFLAEHGITHGRFTVLMLLNRFCDRPSTPAELAEEAAVTRATMTGLIDTLEKDGFVARDADPTDRRAVLVKLTEAGVAFMEDMVPKYFRCVSAIMQPLTEPERQQLVRLLQRIQGGLLPEPFTSPAQPAVHI